MGVFGRRRRLWTLSLVTAAAMLENANKSLLPAMYREVGAALGALPAELGTITLCRGLVQALCYPLAMCAEARFYRTRIVAAGTFLCAVAAVLIAASTTFLQMAIAGGFNGVGLALVLPGVYSLVADYSDDETRGATFGWVYMAQGMGTAMGNSLGVLLAPTSFFGGVPGWRLAFLAIALVSISLALPTWLVAGDDDDSRAADGSGSTSITAMASAVAGGAKAVASVPTFWIVVAQGVAAQVPWSALTFMAMWLELVGFSHWETTVVTDLNGLSNGLGALVAGFAGDLAARRFPDTGRIALAQISNASTVPLAALLLLLARPGWPLAGAVYAGGFLLLGVAMAWSTGSTSNPIFAEIVPEKARTTVYALDLCFENVVASFGAPAVGVLAEHVFGYHGRPAASDHGDRENAVALGKAVFAVIAVTATACCLTCSALYWTYPVDRRRARMMDASQQEEPSVGDERNGGGGEASGPAVASSADDGLSQALLSPTMNL
ncbi:hypothetical protein SETIT_8G203000v2 [Setaria italica]|uniref:Major facilitator superfamily (MFS) profile domain-containing protein n=1 Tax=Setaria italica TaxID=4555 RepID=K3ZI72_SETIT|nr:uncharacterized protein LOC101753478 [Setaria italica]RCV39181.1 hypothetical protein SETIT_8G203000v2 [Setaria italica]